MVLIAVLLLVLIATELILVATAKAVATGIVPVLLLITAEIPWTRVLVAAKVISVAGIVTIVVGSTAKAAAAESVGKIQSGQGRV